MLKRLREANLAREAERDPKAVASLLYRAVELGGEAGECLNVVKKLERERLGIAGIDLEAALVRKFNTSSEKLGAKTRM